MKRLHHKDDENRFDAKRNHQRLGERQSDLPWNGNKPCRQPVPLAPQASCYTPVGCAEGKIAVLRRIVEILQRFVQPSECPSAGGYSNSDHGEDCGECHLKAGIFD